jgi:hypothetical protein
MLRQNETPQHLCISHADAGSGACAQGFSANEIASGAILAEEDEQSNVVAWYDGGSFRPLRHPLLHLPPSYAGHRFSMLQTKAAPAGGQEPLGLTGTGGLKIAEPWWGTNIYIRVLPCSTLVSKSFRKRMRPP